jgi:steroid delta-isomerase-like uncharacterized protein
VSEENKALVRRWYEELFNEGNLDVADEIVSSNHISHDPTLPDLPVGPDGQKQLVNFYRGAFPDARIAIEDQMAEGDKVTTRWTGRGNHQGELMGVAPTGNQVSVSGISISRISEGKIEETWTIYDALGMMQQIGAVPSPGQAGG